MFEGRGANRSWKEKGGKKSAVQGPLKKFLFRNDEGELIGASVRPYAV